MTTWQEPLVVKKKALPPLIKVNVLLLSSIEYGQVNFLCAPTQNHLICRKIIYSPHQRDFYLKIPVPSDIKCKSHDYS